MAGTGILLRHPRRRTIAGGDCAPRKAALCRRAEIFHVDPSSRIIALWRAGKTCHGPGWQPVLSLHAYHHRLPSTAARPRTNLASMSWILNPDGDGGGKRKRPAKPPTASEGDAPTAPQAEGYVAKNEPAAPFVD